MNSAIFPKLVKKTKNVSIFWRHSLVINSWLQQNKFHTCITHL